LKTKQNIALKHNLLGEQAEIAITDYESSLKKFTEGVLMLTNMLHYC
jgi:hypothetical protein